MAQYMVVVFKNKLRKKIVKKFQKGKSAKKFFEDLVKENSKIIFPTVFVNGGESDYEIGLLEKNSNRLIPTYITDDFGRSKKVKLEDSNYTILEIHSYKVPETIFDISKKKKITVEYFLSRYMPKTTMKVMSVLNNKVILQNDDQIFLFSLKSETESLRFLNCVSQFFFKEKRGDCIFVSDTSSPQRKYLLSYLESKGFDKKMLYRKFTTHPRH